MLNPRISLEGAYDLHIHTGPCIYPRYLDDVEAARQARAAGLAGIMIKSHHESTVSRAYHTRLAVPGLKVFGGLTLNYFVGGINSRIVEAVLEQGAKEIWMPTIDSAEHRRVFGSRGYGLKSMGAAEGEDDFPGITVLDASGRLTKEAAQVIELVGQAKAILGTSHLSFQEIVAVVSHARLTGAKPLITHPFFTLPNLNLDQLRHLVDLGAMIELTAVTVFNLPSLHRPPLHRIKEAIEALGPDKFIISSDAGQPFNPSPVEALRVYAESLYELGVSKTDLRLMMVENPQRLLGE